MDPKSHACKQTSDIVLITSGAERGAGVDLAQGIGLKRALNYFEKIILQFYFSEELKIHLLLKIYLLISKNDGKNVFGPLI